MSRRLVELSLLFDLVNDRLYPDASHEACAVYTDHTVIVRGQENSEYFCWIC